MVLSLAGQQYALPVGAVEEIIRAVAVARLPDAPGITEGVIDVRGQFVPVLDVRRCFGLAARAIAPADHFVIARAGTRVVALRGDGPARIERVSTERIRTTGEIVPGISGVAGLVTLPDGIVLIADLAAFLSAAESHALDAALSAYASGDEARR